MQRREPRLEQIDQDVVNQIERVAQGSHVTNGGEVQQRKWSPCRLADRHHEYRSEGDPLQRVAQRLPEPGGTVEEREEQHGGRERQEKSPPQRRGSPFGIENRISSQRQHAAEENRVDARVARQVGTVSRRIEA